MADNNAAAAVEEEQDVMLQQQQQQAHEIPTSDHDDEEDDTQHQQQYYHHPHDEFHSTGYTNSSSSFYSPPHPFPMHHHHPHSAAAAVVPPMMLPPIPPPPPPPPPPDSSNNNNSNDQQLDFTRQYYEARMREHAMQYASAAAGAAWAAARMANLPHFGGSGVLDNNGLLMMNSPPGYQQFHPDYHHHHHHQLQQHQLQQQPPPQQRRKLWKPPKSSSHTNEIQKIKKLKHHSDNNYNHATNHNHTDEGGVKKSSKKRESGNDSVSSLGSERSYHHHHQQQGQQQHGQQIHDHHSQQQQHQQQQQHGQQQQQQQPQRHHSATANNATTTINNKNHKKGKKNQRRRFNEEEDEQQQQQQHHHQQHHQHQYGQNYSSKSSFSSFGSSGGGGRKKKNRSTTILPPPMLLSSSNNNNSNNNNSNNTIQGVFLGGLIGKTGVSALHELCHKYRWEKPVYTLMEGSSNGNVVDHVGSSGGGGGVGVTSGDSKEGTNNDTSNNNTTTTNNNNRINTTNQYQVHPHEFVLAVHVNRIELGRGRGDSKTAAKQDGSRKALAALVPGVVFDPNGILLDVGGGGGGAAAGGAGGRGLHRQQQHDRLSGSSSGGGGVTTSMEELGPHLASQLAIGGGNTTNNGGGGMQRSSNSRPSSPDHSETSSISTSVSMTKMTRVGSISSMDNTGSGEGGGVISGGPVGIMGSRYCSSNIYPCASTTSGVSSASEVEDGDENAYYASRGASVCSTLLQAMWQIDDRIRQPPSYAFDVYPIPPSSAKESGGGGIEQPNKRRKSGGPSSSESKKPAHRGTFQCTATLNLYFRMEEGKEYSPSSLMECWESPLEYLQTRDKKLSSSYGDNVVSSSQESRKRKDSFASQATLSPDRRQLKGDDDGNDDEPDNSASKRQKVDEFVKHTLESIATGSTKRESKHKASAKLLTLLFPECSSLVEVKAAAEAARECYAATKAMASQTKRAKLSDKGSPERGGGGGGGGGGGPAKRPGNLLAKSDSFVSVAGLSLSEEPVDESKRIKWCDSTEAESNTGFDVSFECEVDIALKSLRDQEEEPSDDVGRIVLCRAQPDDAEFIYALLKKANESNRCGEMVNVRADADSGEDVTNSAHGSDSIYLLLSRAVSSHERLGCAILTLASSSLGGGRSLVLRSIGHEEHLPRERFMECLEAFASKLETNLDTSSIFNDVRLISPEEIRKCFSRPKSNSACSPPTYQDGEVISMKGNSSHTHSLLQSVKEEDSEDADEGSDGDNMEKEVDRTHDPEANNGKRPLRSKRRREIHDQQKH